MARWFLTPDDLTSFLEFNRVGYHVETENSKSKPEKSEALCRGRTGLGFPARRLHDKAVARLETLQERRTM
jgi:hypothetical protein